MTLVESGIDWTTAHMQIYPEFGELKSVHSVKAFNLKNRSPSFKQFLAKRGKRFGNERLLPKSHFVDQWKMISEFNMAMLYEDAGNGDGTVALRKDWLEDARKHNVIKRIVVTKKTIRKNNGDETIVETTDIIPYSRDYALAKLSKMLGYETILDKIPGNVNMTQNNNMFLVDHINKTMKSFDKNKMLTGDKKLVIDEKFFDTMINAKIVSKEEQGNGG